MKGWLYLFAFAVVVGMVAVRCAPESSAPTQTQAQSLLAMESPRPVLPTGTPLPTSTPMPVYTSTVDAALMAQITLVFAQATDTQIAVAKTEAAFVAMQTTQQYQQLMTAQMVQTQNAMTANAMTAQATQTQIAQTAGAHVTMTHLAATQEIFDAEVQASKVRSWAGTLFLILLGGVVLLWLGAKAWGEWKMQAAKYLQASQIDHDHNGRLPAVPADALGRNGKLVNPNLAHRAVLDPEKDDLSAEQALANTQSLRGLEATRAIAQSPGWMRQVTKKQLPAGNEPDSELPRANVEISKLGAPLLTSRESILTPDWSIMEGWDGKGAIPLGVTTSGLLRVDLQSNHHFGVFGATGEGKSRYLLRPFIAALLAAGQRVVILGKTGDFWPFAEHPNVKMIAVRRVTDPEEAQRYAGYLKRMVDEMDRRDEYLTKFRVSTWERAGHPATYVVLDEVGNALSKMPPKIKEESYRWLDSLAREGRKAGFNLITASQRAVGFKSIIEQMRRIVFHVEDADTSRIALGFPGAEELPTNSGQFFARIGNVNRCMSFDPSDEQLQAFLSSRPAPTLEPIDWIEGEVIGEQSVNNEPESQPADDVDTRIRKVLERMIAEDRVSLSQVEREVWGEAKGGAQFRRVQATYVEMKQQSGETPTTTQNLPGSEPLAA